MREFSLIALVVILFVGCTAVQPTGRTVKEVVEPLAVLRVGETYVLVPEADVAKATAGRRVGTLGRGARVRMAGVKTWDTWTQGVRRIPIGVIETGAFAGTRVSLAHRGVAGVLR